MTEGLNEFYATTLRPEISSANDIRRFVERMSEGVLIRDADPLNHVCVMVVVFDPLAGTVLVINHRKAGSWIFPGGHVDEVELPDRTAVRELAEELGLEVGTQDLLGPFSFKVLDIDSPTQRCREHYDLFYALATTPSSVRPDTDEFYGAEWLTLAATRERISSPYYRGALAAFAAFIGI